LTVTVKDSGVGMTQDFIDNQLFEPFSSANKKNGLGIGMYHVKSILDSLNADVTVDSTPGIGTEFQIVIPLKTEDV
jgi:signal transduction histidine kinase